MVSTPISTDSTEVAQAPTGVLMGPKTQNGIKTKWWINNLWHSNAHKQTLTHANAHKCKRKRSHMQTLRLAIANDHTCKCSHIQTLTYANAYTCHTSTHMPYKRVRAHLLAHTCTHVKTHTRRRKQKHVQPSGHGVNERLLHTNTHTRASAHIQAHLRTCKKHIPDAESRSMFSQAGMVLMNVSCSTSACTGFSKARSMCILRRATPPPER